VIETRARLAHERERKAKIWDGRRTAKAETREKIAAKHEQPRVPQTRSSIERDVFKGARKAAKTGSRILGFFAKPAEILGNVMSGPFGAHAEPVLIKDQANALKLR
jgi:hypothetical protein